jgi:Na+-translocating ferredoxin:NAD+ oxidoreductase RnfD subunit
MAYSSPESSHVQTDKPYPYKLTTPMCASAPCSEQILDRHSSHTAGFRVHPLNSTAFSRINDWDLKTSIFWLTTPLLPFITQEFEYALLCSVLRAKFTQAITHTRFCTVAQLIAAVFIYASKICWRLEVKYDYKEQTFCANSLIYMSRPIVAF